MVPGHVSRSLVAVLIGSGLFCATGHQAAAQKKTAPAVAPLAGVAIQNPSFETVEGDRAAATPAGWKAQRFGGQPEFGVDASAPHTGQMCARIAAREGADGAWTTIVAVKPYSRYRLSAWVKTDRVQAGTGRGALLSLAGVSERPQTSPITGTVDWTAVDVAFDSGPSDAVQINCQLGGRGRSTGTAWFDDVKLEVLASRALKPAVVIDPARRRPAMSKYIYGQFIEHLGRCIYGGIWAEMIDDRKFYYDIDAKDSPWKRAGDPAIVLMNPIEVFVGVHSPEIRLRGDKPGGILQEDLGLVAGKRYTGRIVLAGSPGAAPIRVTLAWGDGPGDRETQTVSALQPSYRTYALSFTSKADTEHGRIEITSSGRGAFRVGAVSLMPADNVQGFRADTLRLLEELNAPVYRWPGGNFVSGYNWQDGIGDRDRRPPRKNPAWRGVEHNDVGIHEFMALCELIGAEPYIAVNSGFGDAAMAADEVEYVNGAPSTPMGRLRAANGHERPFGARWWSIGNEMYGNWQIGHMPVGDYIPKHIAFAAAMKAKDPGIHIIGVGETGPWDEAMLAGAGPQMDLVSEHFYCQESPGVSGHVAQIPTQIRRIADAVRKYRQTIPALAGQNLQVALDEWNYWYGPHLYGELGTRYFLKDALGIAAGFNEYSRQSDIIFMANYAQTVNVIGAIKTTKTAAALDATGVVLKLYREHFGSIPVEVRGAPEPLDVAATLREGRPGDAGTGAGRIASTLVLSVVNPTAEPQTLALALAAGRLPATGRLWRIAGSDPKAYNEPGKPPAIAVQETASAPLSKAWTVPPLSISLIEVSLPASRGTN